MEKEQKNKSIMILAGISEILVLSVAYYRIWDLYRDLLGQDLFHFRGKFFLIGLYSIITYLTFRACESFRFDKFKFIDIAISQSISCIMINGITWLQVCLVVNGLITPLPLVLLTLIDILICLLFSFLLTRYFTRNSGFRDALLIYGNESALILKEKLERQERTYEISETVSAERGFNELQGFIDRHSYILINDIPPQLRNDLLKYCFSGGKVIYVVPKITDIIMRGAEDLSTLDTPIELIRNEGLNPMESFLKRSMDLVFAGVAMIPCSVLMLLISAAIKLEDRGPVFYRQKRVTVNGKVFDILKFRSMIVNAEESTGAVLACEDDPRITKVGRVLRSCRLDELPQLINILKGEMSLVGPRPERVELTEQICKEMPEFAYRTMVKAGLTGYAQVYGKYNTSNYDKLRLDMIYIQQYSLLLDIKLILMTPQILFRKEAAEGVQKEAAAESLPVGGTSSGTSEALEASGTMGTSETSEASETSETSGTSGTSEASGTSSGTSGETGCRE